MKEILLTSSALILALLILRQMFRNRISRRAQYALWLLVLVRLLVPVNLPAADFSLLTAAEPVSQAVTQRLEGQMVYALPTEVYDYSNPDGAEASPAAGNFGLTDDSMDIVDRTRHTNVAPDGTVQSAYYSGGVIADADQSTHYFFMAPISELLTALWYTGMVLMGLWLLVSNLRFWHKLRKVRKPYSLEGCKYPVYLVESGLPSPCLFGLFRPAIYLTPAAAATPERLRHVIAHESAHARHLDHLWALLRGVCLAVWWFNPLVWAAAAASRADGELACDEAALAALGPGERVPYGRTLLALIPVSRGSGDPLLSATTMTAGKRRLKDRITRIAENRRTRAAALLAVIALAAAVCAVTFTGGKGGDTAANPGTPEPLEDAVPLTGDELAYFNEVFFNSGTVNYVVGVNLHNQFLTSNYVRPKDIDLYALFYCGTGLPGSISEEELRQVGSFDENGAQICPTDKLPAADLDQILLENTGLTLDETEKIGLEQFQYLPEYDAYYHTHGDTNYLHNIYVAAGERAGNTFRLYYTQTGAWSCVTLERQGDGSYWFVSNQPAEKPAIATVYPAGDPALTISLTDLASYAPAPAQVTRRADDCAERGGGMVLDAEDGEQVHVCPYRSTDGNMYLALVYDSAVGNGQMITWDVGNFFTFPEDGRFPNGVDSVTLGFFSDLFGHDGLVVSYSAPDTVYQRSTVHDYYYFEDADTPVLLARAAGTETAVVDLNGDGENELLTDGNLLFFRREGQLYEADITALLEDNWPQLIWWDYSLMDTSRRCLTVRGFMSMPAWGEGAQCDFVRSIYFDGGSLLVYDQLEDTVDHAAESVLSADVPEQVLSDAKAQVQSDYAAATSGALEGSVYAQPYDDWRLSYLRLTGTYTDFPTGPIEVYSVGCNFHAADPMNVVLAGGMYIQEDGWVGGFNTGFSPYLVYEVQEDGSRVRLESRLAGDYSEDSPMYRADLCSTLMASGLLTWETMPGKDLLNMFQINESAFLNNLSAGADEAAQETALASMVAYASTSSDASERDLLEMGLKNLEQSSSALTEAGRAAYERLLSLVNGEPTEADIHAAILDHRANATDHVFELAAEAHEVLDRTWEDGACTVYLEIYFSAYDRTDEGWKLGTDGQFPAAITFVPSDGGWAVQEYWEPLGGAHYAPDLQAKFPPDAYDAVFSDDDLDARLQAQCRAAAEQAMV